MKNTKKNLITAILACTLGCTVLCSCGERLEAPPGEISASLSENMLYNDYAALEKVTGDDATKLHKGTLTIACGEEKYTPVEYITALYENGQKIYDYQRDTVSEMENLPVIDCTENPQLSFMFENESYREIQYQLWTPDGYTLADDDHDGSLADKFVMPSEPGEYIGGVILKWDDGNGQTVLSEYFFRIKC